MTHTFGGLILAAVAMGATAARADEATWRVGVSTSYGGYGYQAGAHYHGAQAVNAQACDVRHDVQPQAQAQGQYVWQTVQRWVAATTTQVWVDGRCVTRGQGHRGRGNTRCFPGRYETVSTPGHYEARQEWVWVAATPTQRWGRNGYHVAGR